MTSSPHPPERVDPGIYNFFQAELRNEDAMRREANWKNRDEPPTSTLETAHDSLCQAPLDVIRDWLLIDSDCDGALVHALIKFGELIGRYGEEAELRDFEEEAPCTQP